MRIPHQLAVCAFGLAAIVAGASSCKKDDNTPKPVEQELITTVKLSFLEDGTLGPTRSFRYKVSNGFNNVTGDSVLIDTVRLQPSRTYSVSVDIYNEKATPVDTTTTEIDAENQDHLFYYASTPAFGPGSLIPVAGSGNLDKNGKPFNRMLKMTTGLAGTGNLQVTLIHEPIDKTATTRTAIGGETDADANFPVKIQ